MDLAKSKIPLVGFLLGVGTSSVLFRSLFFVDPAKHLWAGTFDTQLLNWIVAWGYHALVELRDWQAFWNANAFYPHALTLAYSDSMLGVQPFYIPFRLLGFSPLTSLYLALALINVAACTFSDSALLRMGGLSWIERVLIIFVAHFSLVVTNFFYHYQLFGFQFAPPFFLFLYLFLRDGKTPDLLCACLIYCWGVCIAVYLAPMLFVASAFLALIMFVQSSLQSGIRETLRKFSLTHFVLVASSACCLYLIQLRPYFSLEDRFPVHPFAEKVVYSASLRSFFTEISEHSYWYSSSYVYGDWEHAVFPGYLLCAVVLAALALLAYFLLRSYLAKAEGRKAILQHSDFSLLLFAGIVFLFSLTLAWGPFYKSNHNLKFPYYYLSQVFPGLQSIRAPGRFAMFLALPMGLFSVLLVRQFKLSTRWHTLALGILLLMLAVESLPIHKVHPYDVDNNGIYARLGETINEGEVLIQLPVAGKDHFQTLDNTMRQLNGSISHWGRLIVGYGAKSSPEHLELVKIDREFAAGLRSVADFLAFAEGLNANYLLVDLSKYPESLAASFSALPGSNSGKVKKVWEESSFLLLSLPS